MGVKGLWKILSPASEEKLFTEYVSEQFQLLGRPYKIGIDINQKFSRGHLGYGENPELQAFFYRLAFYLCMPVSPVFVFDGPGRPAVKRGKKVKFSENWVTPYFREFIDAFGFDHFTAPGEAEAELALLNKQGLLDAVLTEDSDVFVFGADTVLRGGKKGNTITLYKARDIEQHPDLQLSAGGLFLMPFVCGGDYILSKPDGCAKGIGHKLALCGFGNVLRNAAKALDDAELEGFLRTWRNNVKLELQTDSQHVLGRQYQSIANKIDDTFCTASTVRQYSTPSVSPIPLPPDHIAYHAGKKQIDPARLAGLCNHHFGWGFEGRRNISAIFARNIWPGVTLRAMIADTFPIGPITSIVSTFKLGSFAEAKPMHKRKRNEHAATPVTVNVAWLDNLLRSGVTGSSLDSDDHPQAQIVDISVPPFATSHFKARSVNSLQRPAEARAGPSREDRPGSSLSNPIELLDAESNSPSLRDEYDVVTLSSGISVVLE